MATEFNVNEAVGEALRSLRVEQKKTQEEVAKAIGRSQVSISHLEKGRRTPTTSDLYKLANHYGVAGSELLLRAESSVAKTKQAIREEETHGKEKED